MCVSSQDGKIDFFFFFFLTPETRLVFNDWSLMTGLSKDVSSLKSYAKAKHLIYYSVLMQQQQHRLIIK